MTGVRDAKVSPQSPSCTPSQLLLFLLLATEAIGQCRLLGLTQGWVPPRDTGTRPAPCVPGAGRLVRSSQPRPPCRQASAAALAPLARCLQAGHSLVPRSGGPTRAPGAMVLLQTQLIPQTPEHWAPLPPPPLTCPFHHSPPCPLPKPPPLLRLLLQPQCPPHPRGGGAGSQAGPGVSGATGLGASCRLRLWPSAFLPIAPEGWEGSSPALPVRPGGQLQREVRGGHREMVPGRGRAAGGEIHPPRVEEWVSGAPWVALDSMPDPSPRFRREEAHDAPTLRAAPPAQP